MRIQGWFFAATAAFFAFIAGLYWLTASEDTGTTLLAGTAVLGIIPGLFLLRASRGSPLPEDRADATIDQGGGEIGAFPPQSFWPVTLAAGLLLAAVGAVFRGWFAVPGALVMVTAAAGAVLESRRGGGRTP